MISEKYNFVFVHIPKAAGQSIAHFFLKLHGLSWKQRSGLLLQHNPDPSRGPERLAHMTAREYVEFGYLSPEEFANYYKFSFVRNPWDRLVSEYKFGKYDRKYSFKEFVYTGLPVRSCYADDYRHILPQYDFLFDENGNMLVDFVGRFERLQHDFDLICSRLGLPVSKLAHYNSSSKQNRVVEKMKSLVSNKPVPAKDHYTEYYDDELVGVVSEMYHMDIKYFNYTFSK